MAENKEKSVSKQNLTLVKDCKEMFTQEEKFFIKELIVQELSEIIANLNYDDDNQVYQGFNSTCLKYLWRKRDALNKLYEIFN